MDQALKQYVYYILYVYYTLILILILSRFVFFQDSLWLLEPLEWSPGQGNVLVREVEVLLCR